MEWIPGSLQMEIMIWLFICFEIFLQRKENNIKCGVCWRVSVTVRACMCFTTSNQYVF